MHTHTIVGNYQQSSTAHLDIKSSHKINETIVIVCYSFTQNECREL